MILNGRHHKGNVSLVGRTQKKKASYFSKLTIIINEQGQILPEVRVDIEQQSRTLAGPEAQGDVFSSQCHIRIDGER